MNNLPLIEVKELEAPKPRNQWHEKLLNQANQPAVSQRLLTDQSKPIEPCRGYDWPESAR